MTEAAKGKRVLFITTKNLDYIRNSQEIRLLKEEAASVEVIGSMEKSYAKRLAYVYRKLFTAKMNDYDLVFVGFAPQLIVPFWKKIRKKTLVIDFFISMYDTLVCDRKKFREGSLPARLVKHLDKKTLRLADHVITDTKAHGAYFASELGADPKKEEVLYLEADESIYYKRPQKKSEELKDKYVVLYFGSILPLQGVEVILEAVRELKDDSELFFYIIGPLKEGMKAPEGENISYISWLSQTDLAEKISEADLCLAGHFNKEIGKARRTIPGKAYIYQAMGKQMLLGDNPATRELYSEENGDQFVEMGNPKALADKIRSMKEGWKGEHK